VYVAYASESLALATLEYLAHIDRSLVPADLVSISAVVPDDGIETLDIAALPIDWRASPPPIRLRELGDEWVATAKSLALRVPSVIVPSESNILINPHHPRFAEVRSDLPKPIVLDPRLTT
jgi:RES domain-containing protein